MRVLWYMGRLGRKRIKVKFAQEIVKGERMMDNLNLKPQSPDEVKTMMWTGENQREMFDLLTCGKKNDDYMTVSGENFFIDHIFRMRERLMTNGTNRSNDNKRIPIK